MKVRAPYAAWAKRDSIKFAPKSFVHTFRYWEAYVRENENNHHVTYNMIFSSARCFVFFNQNLQFTNFQIFLSSVTKCYW